MQTSTVVLATLGTVTTAALAYAVYFDYKRRSDPNFRRSLKRQAKQVNKAAKDEAVAAEKGQKEKIRSVVDSANEDGFPTDPEKTEEYFMTEVARGEQMCQDGSDPVDAALCFYKALKVYPQPRELINIYDKTVPKVCYTVSIFSSVHALTNHTAHPRHPRRDDRRRQQHTSQRSRSRRRRVDVSRPLHPSNSSARTHDFVVLLVPLMAVLPYPLCTYISCPDRIQKFQKSLLKSITRSPLYQPYLTLQCLKSPQ